MPACAAILGFLAALLAGVPALPGAEGPGEKPETKEEGAAAVGAAAGEVAREAGEMTAEAAGGAVFSLRDDLWRFPSRVWRDLRGIPTLGNGLVLGGGAALAGIYAASVDDDVRDAISRDPRRFGRRGNHFLDNVGQSWAQLAAAGAVYGTSVFVGSDLLHETSLDAIHSLTLEIPTVWALKKAFNTTRPNGEREGFPSGHVASTFAMAAVVHENFGLVPGLFGYAIGSAVAFHRVDVAKHDLSDVVFGAALGTVIGATVSRNRSLPVADVEIEPLVDPSSGAVGGQIRKNFP